MDARFKIKMDDDVEVFVIKDQKTGKKGVHSYKKEDDISFLKALCIASNDLLNQLEESESDKDQEATHECEKEPEEKKKDQPTYYSGVVEIVKGDSKIFITGTKINIVDGQPSYFTGDIVNDFCAFILLKGIKFKNFEGLRLLFSTIGVEVKEVKEDTK